MPAATFGDLIRAGRADLDAAAALAADEAAATGSTIAGLYRLVTVMSRCAGDLVPYGDAEIVANRPPPGPWVRAAAEARNALGMAAGALHGAAAQTAGAALDAASPAAGGLAGHLAGAALSLAAARDLLHTHVGTGAYGQRLPRSDWAAVVTSAPVAGALLDELASWVRQLAPAVAGLSWAGRDAAVPAAVCDGLAAAGWWLHAAAAAIRPAQQAGPVTGAQRGLLYAIPAYAPPARRPAHDQETVAGLCQGITGGAGRLRAAARGIAADATWAPAATASAWRYTATAAAVTGHSGALVLGLLAGRAAAIGDPAAGRLIHVAAGAVGEAWRAWQRVVAAWGVITTETTGIGSPAVAEAGDLVLRTGRLAWDPAWTPASGQPASLRDAAGLAPDRAAIAAVAAALHHTWDALSATAAADLQAVGGAVRAGRLYVPTRTLPERYNVPYRFGPALPSQIAALSDAYQAAADASIRAVTALDDVAVALDAPSAILPLARAAALHQHGHDHPAAEPGAPGSVVPPAPAAADPQHGPLLHEGQAVPAPADDAQSAGAPRVPGPVEQATLDLGTTDPLLISRAATIDQAAHGLLTQATEASQHRTVLRAAGDTTRIAAQGFPAGPLAAHPASPDAPHPDSAPAARPRSPIPGGGSAGPRPST